MTTPLGNKHLPPGGAVEVRDDDPRWMGKCDYCAEWRKAAAAAIVHPITGKRYLYDTPQSEKK